MYKKPLQTEYRLQRFSLGILTSQPESKPSEAGSIWNFSYLPPFSQTANQRSVCGLKRRSSGVNALRRIGRFSLGILVSPPESKPSEAGSIRRGGVAEHKN